MRKRKITLPIEFGEKYADSLHGIEGKATSYILYDTGCDQVKLEWVVGGEVKEHWVDITRVKKVPKPELVERTGGGPSKAPSVPTRGTR